MANLLSSQAGIAQGGAAWAGEAYAVPGGIGGATEARVSQEMAEALLGVVVTQVDGRVSQVMTDVLLSVVLTQVTGRVSQLMVEVLVSVTPLVQRRGTTGRWFGDLAGWMTGEGQDSPYDYV